MDRRGFFASVLALPVLVTRKRSDFCHTAPVIIGVGTGGLRPVILPPGTIWVIPSYRENI